MPCIERVPTTEYMIAVKSAPFSLSERFACFRPLRRVAAWLTDQGLAIAPGTVAGSVPRFLPLFEPLAKAILAHQNEMAVRHGDETGWRIQSLSETGRSRRAWLWISVSAEAVYFLIDPSRSDMIVLRLLDSTPACKRSFSSRATSAW